MKHRFLFILLACPIFHSYANKSPAFSDSTGKGVQFDNGRWKEILKKAKKENKYVFVDCYTTWCVPCKRMESEVYVKPEVGNYMNNHFIPVKIQMDKKVSDDEQTKERYPDADLIQKKYGIPGYPAYFIFSPDGKLVSRGAGLKFPEDLLGFLASAIDPNAEHPYARYYVLLSEYQKGINNFKSMPELIDTATLLGQRDVADTLTKSYNAYLATLSDEQLFNPQMISYLARHIQSSDSKYFHLFYPNEEKINVLIGTNGFAQLVVGRVITNEYITPLLSAKFEPDWTGMIKTITNEYDSSYAEENVLKARVKWYEGIHDHANQFKYLTLLIKKYSANMAANNGDECTNLMDCDLNTQCWDVFKFSVDKDQIDAATECMKAVLERYHLRGQEFVWTYVDTYANLLYKAGRTEEAIQQEEEAIKNLIKFKGSAKDIKPFQDTVDKMKEGKPTWPHYIDKDDFFGMGLM